MLCKSIMDKSIMDSYGIEIKTTITKEGLADLFGNCLCSWSLGYGMLSLDLDEEHYIHARQVARSKSEREHPYLEEVYSEALLLGYPIEVKDAYNGAEFEVDLSSMHKNFDNIADYHMRRILNLEDDSCTHDGILQTLILGEETYC